MARASARTDTGKRPSHGPGRALEGIRGGLAIGLWSLSRRDRVGVASHRPRPARAAGGPGASGRTSRPSPAELLAARSVPSMLFQDRAADRQAHPQSVRLGGHERLEEPVDHVGGDPGARVLELGLHARPVRRAAAASARSAARGRRSRRLVHRGERVEHQVQHDLLELDRVPGGRREVRGEVELDRHPVQDAVDRARSARPCGSRR